MTIEIGRLLRAGTTGFVVGCLHCPDTNNKHHCNQHNYTFHNYLLVLN